MTTTTDWVEVANSFRPQIEASADEAEQNRRLPADLIDAWRDAGMFNLHVPKEYGGLEVDFATFLRVIEETAAADGSAGWTLMIGAGGAIFGAFMEPSTAREIFSSGRTIIAGSVTPRRAATAVEGGYLVSGRWPFASGSPNADWILAYALEPDAGPPPELPGPPRPGLAGMPSMRAFVIPASDCRIIDTWTSLGLRATSSHDFEVQDVLVPSERSFLSGLDAKAQVAGSIYKGGIVNLLQMGIIGVHLGIARAAIDFVIQLANEKTPTARPSKLRDSQLAQNQIGQAEALRLSARAFAFETVSIIEEALQSRGALTPLEAARRQMMVAQVAKACAQAVDIAYEVGGTTGVYAGNKLERCFRDIHVATQHMGVSANQLTLAGFNLLNEAVDPTTAHT